jgi:TPR repeat protein
MNYKYRKRRHIHIQAREITPSTMQGSESIMPLFKHLFVAIVLASAFIAMAGPVKAGPFEEGVAAYEHNDFETALKIWKPLADQGNAGAQFYLGLIYDLGQGVVQSDKEAVRFYRLAADQGQAMAQYYLGLMYDNGQGVTQDDKEAMRLYRLAGDQGSVLAQFHIGFMYENGRGITQDYNEALKWYGLAAHQGDETAQYSLGLMYTDGRGVPPDLVLGYMWIALAAAAGDTSAAGTQNMLAAKLIPSQLKEGQELFRKCKASNYKICER